MSPWTNRQCFIAVQGNTIEPEISLVENGSAGTHATATGSGIAPFGQAARQCHVCQGEYAQRQLGGNSTRNVEEAEGVGRIRQKRAIAPSVLPWPRMVMLVVIGGRAFGPYQLLSAVVKSYVVPEAKAIVALPPVLLAALIASRRLTVSPSVA